MAQLLAAGAVALSIPLLWWSVSGARLRPRVVRTRLSGPGADLRQVMLERPASERVVEPWIGRLAGWARRISPAGIVDSTERKLDLAGLDWPVERVLAMRVVFGLVGLLLGGFGFLSNPSAMSLLLAVGGTLLGYLLPTMLLDARSKQRQEEIQLGLPDVLDQVTIAVEAGLGFESAMANVVQHSSGPVVEELARALHDIRIGMSRREALEAMRQRTDVEDLRHFLTALGQAERLGVPIADVLRVQASEMRTKRRQRAEERAQKLPVKILFPLIFTILPALFIVVLGPAAISLSESLVGG